jgi:hypothetical protein
MYGVGLSSDTSLWRAFSAKWVSGFIRPLHFFLGALEDSGAVDALSIAYRSNRKRPGPVGTFALESGCLVVINCLIQA